MRYGDPNCPEGPVDARPTPRHTELDGTGNMAADGFERLERRPRLKRRSGSVYADQHASGYSPHGYGPRIESNEKAGRMEEFFSGAGVPAYID